MLTVLTLLIACFQQLDVVIGAPLLDAPENTEGREEMDRQTETFLSTVLQGILPVIAKASLRLVGGLLGLLMERCALQTVVLSRVRFTAFEVIDVAQLILPLAWTFPPYCFPQPGRSYQVGYDSWHYHPGRNANGNRPCILVRTHLPITTLYLTHLNAQAKCL